MEKTFAIIKPDAVERNLIGKILERIESKGFRIVAMKRVLLTLPVAQGFYHVHKERPFFKDLTEYMCTGPVVLLVFEKDGAIKAWRELMGATNPADADAGTIRKDFAIDLEKNSVHGSDAPDTAAFEISYFFSQTEISS
ncbi:MAG: nucleoside-diphosphate kinase [Nitrospinaceae bacterium]|mgnify:FL=1|jgi:nucleoside-diphosphate kinase|nr:nucleoside-diphosphate kinase [Nitrospinaceae bacterium]HAK38300.1 nucleoside-diphosphate kinase [Nitrospina sp.]|tara:strand:- start:298 stop:714 length:417 start_codon:yes stop_codon:yes gene_type:complete